MAAKKPRTGASDEFSNAWGRRNGTESTFQQTTSDKLHLKDSLTYFVDPADDTKRARIDAGGLATATDVDISVYASTFLGRRRILPSSGNLTLSAAHSGATLLFDAAGATAYVLPAITAAEVGIDYEFFTTVTATGAHSITAGAADLLVGTAIMAVTGADVEVFHPDVSDDLILSMNGSTTGGVAGTWIRVVALSATRWGVLGIINTTGAQATPFA